MPELPEVETTVRDLRPHLIGQRIVAVEVLWDRSVASPDVTSFAEGLTGSQILALGRRGKFLLMHLDGDAVLVVHLRMTGQLWVEPAGGSAPPAGHVRARLTLESGKHLVFADQRKFGRLWLLHDTAALLGALGPEPLAEDFTCEALAGQLHGRRSPIKSLLLNQGIIAGLGNIYADEALFQARIHPLQPGSSLTPDMTTRLHAAIRRVLSEALLDRGTTLRNYRPPAGGQGEHQNQLRVYHKTGSPCPVCGVPIAALRVTQRSTHFCPCCQAAIDSQQGTPSQESPPA